MLDCSRRRDPGSEPPQGFKPADVQQSSRKVAAHCCWCGPTAEIAFGYCIIRKVLNRSSCNPLCPLLVEVVHHRGRGGRDVTRLRLYKRQYEKWDTPRSRDRGVLSFLRISSETSHIFARYILSRSLALLAVILPVLATAQTAAPQLTSNPIFEKQCAKCHQQVPKAGASADRRWCPANRHRCPRKSCTSISNGKGRHATAGKLKPEDIDTL